MRAPLLLAVLAIAGGLSAPATWAADGEERRGSAPPGTSQDGSRPNEGAIKGGSIEPKRGDDSRLERHQEIERCRDLQGTLRQQCVADARKDAARKSPGPER
jgi:hypothetical protein